MNACTLETSGGKPAMSARSGGASFSGPSSRTRAEGAAGAGARVSGILGAALLAAAALLLAPSPARAISDCGPQRGQGGININPIVCSNAAYSDGIFYGGTDTIGDAKTFNIPGRSSGPTTITAGAPQAVGFYVETRQTNYRHITINIGGETSGTAHVINFVQGTNTNNAADRNNGVYLRSNSKYTGNTIDVKSGVTIGTASAPMKQNGIFMDLRGAPVNQETTHTATLTNAATIHARRAGIRLDRLNGGPSGNPTTITNSGAIHAGVDNPGETVNPASPHNAPHGITSLISWTAHTGPMTLTNSGDITVSGAYTGIFINYWGGGNFTASNSGAITATASGGTGVNLDLNSPYVDNVSFTNTGDVTAGALGLRFARDGASTGTTMFDNSGDVTVTGAAGTGVGHAVWLPNAGTRTSTISGAFTIENSGDLRSKNHALYATMTHTGNADALTLTNTGSAISEDGDGIRVERAGTGALILESGGASTTVSGGAFGIYASHTGTAGTVSVTHTAGAVGGRTGILAEVARASGGSDTRATNQPLLDVTWTAGTFTQGTRSETGRFAAATAAEVIALDQEAAAQQAVADTVRYGAAAGIEARVLSWSDVVEQVATGDDPGAIADNTAQMAAVPTTATASNNAYVKQFRAALENDELAVGSVVLTAIDSTATSVDDVTDAEIVAWLRTDNAGRRTLLRNILRHGLSEKEQAVLKAVVTNTGLTAALDDTAAAFGATYKTAVNNLLNSRHLDDLRVTVNGGSIVSRGDGIRAYYVTPNAANGGIDVTIAAGVTVTGGAAGVHVANAGTTTGLTVKQKYRSDWTSGNGETDTTPQYTSGPAGSQTTVNLHNQLVTVSGTVTGGTDAGVRLTGGGVLVLQNAEVNAGSSGVAIVAKPGPALVYIDGTVKGGAGGDAAVHLTGGGSVTVGPNGKVLANGADHAIRGSAAADTPTAVTVATGGALEYKEDVTEQVDGRYEDVAEVVFRVYDQSGAPTSTSTTLQVMADGWLDTSAYPWRPVEAPDPTTSAFTCPDSGRCVLATGAGAVSERTGVYAAVDDASAAGVTRADADQPLIDVTWTGTFAHAEGSSDDDRFEAVNPVQVVAFDRTASAGQAMRYGQAAGIEARVLSWSDVVEQVAQGDAPSAFADNAAQRAAVPTGATAGDNAYVEQFKAAMENDEIAVDSALLSAIDTDGTTGLSDAEIVTYLRTDDAGIRALLQNILAQGLSDGEKSVLRAVATGDDAALDAALTAAGFTDDTNDDEDYWSKVKALRERHNDGDIRVRMSGGSIASRGDGIRAYYATPHADNGGIEVTVSGEGTSVTGAMTGIYAANAGGDIRITVGEDASVTGGTEGIHVANADEGIRVTVAAGASVTGAMAGIHVADAGPGLMLARKYTPGWEAGEDGEELVAVTQGEGADAVPLLDQLVTVEGTVTGGTDAALHLSGGGAVLVLEGGKVHAGSSGVAIRVNDPGPAILYIDGEVKGAAGPEGERAPAAVHLTGGGSVVVGLNGRVEANGAARAIRGGGTAATGVDVVLATAGLIRYREDADEATRARVAGTFAGVAGVRFREHRDGAFTGYSTTLAVGGDGLPDTSGLEPRPVPSPDPTTSTLTCPETGRCVLATGAGAITGRTGVYAAVARASAAGETRTDAEQPLIDVTWTGTFAHEEGSSDEGRFAADSVPKVLVSDRTAAAGKAVGYGAAAGVEAQVLDWREVVEQVAQGDHPGEIADAEAQGNLLSETHADSRRAAILSQFRAALGNEELDVAAAVLTAIDSTATSVADLSDAELVAYLSTDDDATRALLRDVLAQGLSDGEKAVLRTVATGDDAALEAALTAAGFRDDATDDEDYWSKVKALRERHNDGDIRVRMSGGSIASRGDGIRAWYATPHADNGGIEVTVAKDASVTGAVAGIYVANAGPGLMLARKYTPGWKAGDDGETLVSVMQGEGADAVPLLDQLVTVYGTVTGGSDAAVHLSGGGAILVMKGGKVHAGSSGVAIRVNDPGPAIIYVDGEVRGAAGPEDERAPAAVHLTGGGGVVVGPNGRVEANGAERAIRGGGTAATGVDLVLVTDGTTLHRQDVTDRVPDPIGDVEEVRVREVDNGKLTGYGLPLRVGNDGRIDVSGLPERDPTDPGTDPTDPRQPIPPRGPLFTFDCHKAMDGRCRLYEALPSMLLALNGLPSYAERMSAARDGNGAWARVETARGEWEAKKATTMAGGGKLSYDHRRSTGQAGVEFLAGESARVGVSVHALRGKAEMAGVGEVQLDGMGLGASATWLAGELYLDARAALTWYDADIESYTHGKLLKKHMSAMGYGLGVEVGQRVSWGGVWVTPRAGLAWSKVDPDTFVDMEKMPGDPSMRARVSVEDAGSMKGRVGVMLETEAGMGERPAHLFGSLDVEQEFTDETRVRVGEDVLKTELRPTALRLGLGGVFDVAENVTVRATASYQASGSGTNGYAGGLELRMQF